MVLLFRMMMMTVRMMVMRMRMMRMMRMRQDKELYKHWKIIEVVVSLPDPQAQYPLHL
jgi:hypothetical protein